MPKKFIRLDTDFMVEIIYGPDSLNIPMIAIETMAGGRIVLGPVELEKLEAALPEIKGTLIQMMGRKATNAND